MQLIMDNMLKTSNDIYKLMLGMKPEVFSDKMRNDTVFKAEFDRNNKLFLAQMDSVSSKGIIIPPTEKRYTPTILFL